ncbi:MAG: hypothetical protein ACPIA5_02185, partial [Flavobacteriales bacterium]
GRADGGRRRDGRLVLERRHGRRERRVRRSDAACRRACGVGRQSERVPCYAQSSTGCEAGYRLTLPAFGAFTGMHAVEPKRGEEVYLVTEREVIGPVRSMPSRKGFSRLGRR